MQDFEMIQQHLIATILFSLILGANTFSYKDAKNWGKQYPECNGKHQSPIITKSSHHTGFPPINQPLILTHFDKLPTKMTMKNTGHTVEVKADWSGEPPRINGGPLHGNYVFEKATFHWAQKRYAEDMDNSPRFFKDRDANNMETHMFFYRTDLKSFENAQSQKDGLAVIKIWLWSGYFNQEHFFKNVEDNLNKVQSINSTVVIPSFPIASIADDVRIGIIFYEGSLDYPPCSESVTWFIIDGTVPITKNMLNGFRKIKLAEGDVSNVRPVQPLNNRQIKSLGQHKGHEKM